MEIAARDSFHNCKHHRSLLDEAIGRQIPSPTPRCLSFIYCLQISRDLPASAQRPSTHDLKRLYKRLSVRNGSVSSPSTGIQFHLCHTVKLPRNLYVSLRSDRSTNRALQSFPSRTITYQTFAAKVQTLMSGFGLFVGNLEKVGSYRPLQ